MYLYMYTKASIATYDETKAVHMKFSVYGRTQISMQSSALISAFCMYECAYVSEHGDYTLEEMDVFSLEM